MEIDRKVINDIVKGLGISPNKDHRIKTIPC